MAGSNSLLKACGLSYQQIRHILSKTGKWKKKITRQTLSEIECHWKEKVLSPTSSCSAKGDVGKEKEKRYILAMFPYPSGDLHMGHMRVYTVSDVLARYHRLCGHKVLNPIGWDAFGLPAENAAIDRQTAPRTWTESNIARMKGQLQDLRISFDWDREVATCTPEYYRWTQAIFLLMYKQGLAYSMRESVNWDPVDQTVLADEQIDSEGRSWRSGAKVTKKHLTQWYLRATNYTQSLLDGLNTLDPESCRGFANAQREWLRKPTGVRINVRIEPVGETISVFTETPELLYGVDFLQISSSHPLVSSTDCHVQGQRLLTDLVMIHPLTGQEIPIIVGDSHLLTASNNSRLGISVICDEDKELANQFGVKAVPTVLDSQHRLCNSDWLDGLSREEARVVCSERLQKLKIGGWPTSSELRDWLISRQRYWGTPIPIVHCPSCGIVPVPEDQLPVVLPEVDSITREEGNPLISNSEWINTPCPKCGGAGKRETDTMDTFVDSSWYFLRFTDPHNVSQPFSKLAADCLMPVDVYVGGAEHAILHMYYARFFSHFLYDQGWTSHREPFKYQLALGTVHSDCYKLSDSGKYLHRNSVKIKGDEVTEKSSGRPVTHTVEKMSKSKLNGVNPNDVVSKHGVDQTRLYMLANANPRAIKVWNPSLADKLAFPHGKQIVIPKWIHTLWHTVGIIKYRREQLRPDELVDMETDEETIRQINITRNFTVRAASLHLNLTFNLHDVVRVLYESLYTLDKVDLNTKILNKAFERCFADMLILLHPFAPHVTAELWEGLRSSPRLPSSQSHNFKWDEEIFTQEWPVVDGGYKLRLQIVESQSTDENSIIYSETDDMEADQSNPELSSSATHKNSANIYLPAKDFYNMNVTQAVNIALDSNSLVLSRSGGSVPSLASNCRLNVVPNAGLYLL
ncbi:LARS2 [Bugula neritina]|uniref:leucine--tRNA ligase n=2 Tax=Bugula neritina TaxID=10212 RepID=A0A7J7JUC5_BUGNE|nr:LARS2 [Bugula neritina]